jgi:hypothetical protein
MIKIALHGLKDKVELLGVGLEEEIVQRNDVGVKRDCAQRLVASVNRDRLTSKRKTHLELFETLTLVPAALPLFSHPLYCYQTLAGPLRLCAGAALHGGERGIGG